MEDAGVRNRVRLWLRSERALGLGAVPRAASMMQGGDSPEIQAHSAPEPAPADAIAAPGALFEGIGAPNEMAPSGGLIASPSRAPLTSPVLPPEERKARLIAMDQNEVRHCTRCRLCQTRTNTVFGEGNAAARIFFIGEGPGETEDQTGRPFVGRAGQLLERMINAMGLERGDVFIANIVKCRPPQNRVPAPDEVATCTPYLERQIEIVRPEVIVTLGLPASKYMLDSKLSMGKLRGTWHTWRGIKLMPTFHPAYILRQYTPQTRAAVWADLQKVLEALGLPVPKRGGA